MTEQRRIAVELNECGEPAFVLANHVALRQALLAVLLEAIEGLSSGELSLCVNYDAAIDQVGVALLAQPHSGPTEAAERRVAMARDLLTMQNGHLCLASDSPRWRTAVRLLRYRESVRVLVVDDSEELLQLFSRYTTGSRFRVLPARSSQEALQTLAEIRPDLVLLDVMMPPPDGWELLQALRGSEQTGHTPIIVCSVVNEPDLARMLGADDTLPKPVTQDALLAMLSKWATPLPATASSNTLV